jgi:predicted DNA-binding transcriptional regulator YafY
VPHPASRVLAMLELLQTHRRVTGADLAARLGVDERTVRRYAGTLAELGIPVAATRGRHGGYRLAPGYKMPPLMLTDNEALAVVLGLAAADRLGMSNEAPATTVALAKVHRLLPATVTDRLAALQEAVGFPLQPRDGAVRPAPATLLTLGRATRERRRVALSYRSGNGFETLREVDPYGLVFHRGAWYLTGHDHRNGEVDTFPLERIGAVDVGESTFTVPDGFDPVGHVTRAASSSPTWEVEVLLETDVVQAGQRLASMQAELTETADGVLVRTRVARLETMARVLAGLGWPFTIVRPDQLRSAVADYAAQLAERAKRSPAPSL